MSTDFAIADLVTALRRMFDVDEYWVPYVWAQRKFRDDNYHMQSQGLLEDMFYDTFGHFLHKTVAETVLDRRTGSESWDYRYRGEGFSHKEASEPRFTAVWQPGEGPGNATPKYPTWTFEHHIVLSFFPMVVRAALTWDHPSRSGTPRTNVTQSVLLSHAALERSAAAKRPINPIILICSDSVGRVTVDHVLSMDELRSETFRAIRGRLHGRTPTSASLWLARTPKRLASTGFSWHSEGPGLQLTLAEEPLRPGVYIFPKASLVDVPMQSNNKAHFPSSDFVRTQMLNASKEGRFIPVPMWPDIFADRTPPNLYQQMRQEYDELFRARDSQ
jgi:hypothetical protein